MTSSSDAPQMTLPESPNAFTPTRTSSGIMIIEDGEFDPGSEDARFLQSLGVKLPEDS
jgi:hypothetical protein